MAKKTEKGEKNSATWIQFQISDAEYNDIQRAKAERGKSRIPNKDYYRHLLMKGMESELV